MKADRLIVPRWVFDLWRYQITPGGKVVLGGLVLAGLGAVSIIVPIYIVFFALFFLTTFARIVGFLMRPKVRVWGELPRRARIGQVVRVELEVTNVGRLPIYDLMLAFVGLPREIEHVNESAVWPYIAKGETITFPLELRFKKRGLHTPPEVRPHTVFPFHVIRNGFVHHPIGGILVLPSFEPVDEVRMPLGSRYQPGGVAVTALSGDSPEYIGNREYVPGEPVRRLDFRSWARLGKPVVREYQEEYYCRIAVLLDTRGGTKPEGGFFRRDANGKLKIGLRFGDDGLLLVGADAFEDDDTAFEASVSLTAAVGDALSDGEYLIDLFAAGKKLYVFRTGPHAARLDNLLEILASVQPSKGDPIATLAPQLSEELPRISTVVFVCQGWDEKREHLCRDILEAGCGLKLLVVLPEREPEPEELPEGSVVLRPHEIRSGGVRVL